MKVRTEPLLGAAMFGIVIGLIYNIIYTIDLYLSMQRMLDFFSSSNPNLANMPSSFGTPAITYLGCLVVLGTGIGTGIIYAILHNREEPLTGSVAKGGAAAGALSFFISTMIGSVLLGILVIPLLQQVFALDPVMGPLPPEVAGAGIVGAIIGGICGGLFSAVLGAILGALGGALGAGFVK